MQRFPLLLFLLAFLLGAVQSRHHHPRDNYSSKSDVYRKLQARIVPVAASTTRALHSRKVQPATRIHGKRQSTLSSRISAALTQFAQTVDTEAANIRASAVKGSSPETVLSTVKESLGNILKAAQQALTDVRNCASAPAPSGGFQAPPTSPCSLILSIIRCLRHILSTLLDVMDPSFVKANLGDVFSQITGIMAQIISQVESHLPGAINDMIQTGSDVLDAIRSAGFGFDDILNVLKPQ